MPSSTPINRAIRPRLVNALVGLTVLSLFLHVAGSIASIAALRSAPMLDALREQYSLAGVPADLMHDDALRNSLLASTLGNVVLGLLITSLFVVVLFGLLSGSDWGRWSGLTLTVAFLLWNVWRVLPWSATASAPGIYGHFAVILAIVFMAVNLLWLSVAFTKPVVLWFRGRDQLS
ncbi:hypothetical protein [Kocuria sp.]|uniref:hypothetical protein n=1 Tax=Kocuria sp. TaxID=1871328 RepID=UPI0026E09AD2|nr:hypothetical protein [Kocuria sp.]MDO5618175.1 hypothetical protein [Kocuria sp.]